MTQRDEFGRTALHYAAADADLDAVRRLLGTEDVNARDNHDWTPLHFAAQAGAPELVALLLDAGADIAAVTDKGMRRSTGRSCPRARTRSAPSAYCALVEQTRPGRR
ncbi:ankyrin repeat domain-containing protein [Nocardia pseudovaccinii]|uniref:ankyrin repeat domain-containing protein n=1 Tax=Nocardia pseudovaccinii TaxID=189540 RepID=UPI003D91771F